MANLDREYTRILFLENRQSTMLILLFVGIFFFIISSELDIPDYIPLYFGIFTMVFLFLLFYFTEQLNKEIDECKQDG